jgi:hypothetical protein
MGSPVESSTLKMKSPRTQRYLLWGSGLVLAAGIAAVLIVFLRDTGSSEQAPFSTTPVDVVKKPKKVALEPAARVVAGRFILTAVQRKDLAAAWKISGPGIRQGMTYKEWLSGTIPVVPYLEEIKLAPIKVDLSEKNHAMLEVILIPKSKKARPEIFTIDVHKVGKGKKAHWVVNSWAPRSRPTIPNNPNG